MHLEFSNPICGRDDELKALQEEVTVFVNEANEDRNNERAPTSDADGTSRKKRICLLHGKSGTGKTCLVREFTASLDGVYVLEGKYDQYTGVESPFAAIIAALDQLPTKLAKEHEAIVKNQCLWFEAGILTKIIPSFAKYVDAGPVVDDASSVSSIRASLDTEKQLIMASERLAVAFLSFLKAFCTKCQPIVLFLDDMQWMDTHSFRLLQAVLNNSDLQDFVFFGGFRTDEDDAVILMKKFLKAIPTPNVNMEIGDLPFEAVDEFLTALFRRSEQDVESLARVVFRKTAGNPYFIIQQLQTWQSLNVVKYDFSTNQWKWDIEAVQNATDLSNNVVDVVSSRIRAVPENVCRLLKLAACLGYSVETQVLKALSGGVHSNEELKVDDFDAESELFEDILQRAVTENFLERSGESLKFSHDRIQQCVSNLPWVTLGDCIK